MSILTQIFGSRNQRLLKQYQNTVREINALESAIAKLTDAELARHLEIDDPGELIGAERVEHDDVVEPVEELRLERGAHRLHHRRPTLLRRCFGAFCLPRCFSMLICQQSGISNHSGITTNDHC